MTEVVRESRVLFARVQGGMTVQSGEQLLREFIGQVDRVDPGDRCARLCVALRLLIEVSLESLDEDEAAPKAG